MNNIWLGSARRLIRRKPIVNFKKWKILRGDEVIVIAGKDKGKRGVVRSVKRTKNKVIVDGVNYVKKHLKKSTENPKGGWESKEMAVAVSNVALVDPTNGKATKIGYRFVEGKKVRVSKQSGTVIEKPEILTETRFKRDAGVFDTEPDNVMERTYFA